MSENLKYYTSKELVDHNCNKIKAALKLAISVRQVYRLSKKYMENGKGAFVHGIRDRRPVNSLTAEISYSTIFSLFRVDIHSPKAQRKSTKLNL